MVKMADDRYTFAQARARLEDIVVQVRKKDTSLEKSLDLLEEGVRLANACTELSDHTEWRSVAADRDADAPDGLQAENAFPDAAGVDDGNADEPAVDRAAAEQDIADSESAAQSDDDSQANAEHVAQDTDESDEPTPEPLDSDR